MVKYIDFFIKGNDLEKRLGLDEWYSEDNKVRVVKLGDRYRMDVRLKNWSMFKSYWIVGPREREFQSVAGRRKW